jgi:hypothetical protein
MVLFCDLVGSTGLSRRFDPDDLRELIRRYQDAVSGAVIRHGGYVANFSTTASLPISVGRGPMRTMRRRRCAPASMRSLRSAKCHCGRPRGSLSVLSWSATSTLPVVVRPAPWPARHRTSR